MAGMFFLNYISAELRRRRGRTLLTALGLAVGVGLVATVTALSQGLDDAQDQVLRPLTGVGTDMTVSRPVGRNPELMERENGGGAIRLDNVGKPGETFTRDDLVSAQVSFGQAQVDRVRGMDGVAAAAGSLTLNRLQVSGKIPEEPPGGGGGGARFEAHPPGAGGGPPDSIDFKQSTITGVDPAFGPLSRSQIESGAWFSDGGRREAVLSVAYARREKIRVGDTITVKKRKFRVVGLAKQPLGGTSSDVYVRLSELQALSDRRGRVNGMQVRAESTGAVDGVARRIESTVSGAKVTTAADLADRVSGSLVDAKNLSSSLGTALAVVALVAAFLIAGLLTLSSVNKRVRELGTLKAIGWPQRLVVRQVTGESLAQGLLGGVLGAALGIGGAALVTALAPELKATAEGPAAPAGPGAGPGPAPAAFGQGQIESGSQSVALEAPVDPKLILLAIGLALIGGLVSGAIGGARVARLRPADALRSVE